jgi:hypothetical protein
LVGAGTGEVNCKVNGGTAGPCAGKYDAGTEIELVATEANGSEFAGFENGVGDTAGCSTSPCGPFTVSQDSSVDAKFDLQPTLTINTGVGTGAGQVNCEVEGGPTVDEPCASSYPKGTELKLIPDPNPGSEFKGFENGTGSASACTGLTPCVITLNANSSVDAKFDVLAGNQKLKVVLAGTGTGKVECSVESGPFGPCAETYEEEEVVELKAVPNAGSTFGSLSVSGAKSTMTCTGAVNPCEFEVGEAEVVATAEFVQEAPTVTNVNPTEGPAAGGQVVTITGTNFTGAEKVEFGTTPVTCDGTIAHCKVESATEIKVTTPVHAAETVDVTVTTAGGISATGANDKYTFVAAPTVTSVNPTKGPAAGNQTVIITGTNLTEASAVKFGLAAAKSFTVKSATEVEAVTEPQVAGTVDVTVTTAGGISATGANDKYTFVALPIVTEVKPAEGSVLGGNEVEIIGSNLGSAEKVEFGTSEVKPPFKSNSATKVVIKEAPAHAAGTVDVTVTTAGGISATGANDKYTFVVTPTVAEVKPNKGPTAGGTPVTVVGSGLVGATFKVGANSATGVTINGGGSEATMTVPAGAAGTADVTATTKGGTSATGPGDKYTYVGPLSFAVATAGTGTGSVTCNGGACASSYAFGSSVTLAATAGSGSTFNGFSGGGCSGASCTLKIEANTSVTATFTKSTPPPQCKVPKLKGLALGAAKSALTRAHCKAGKVKKPKAKKGKKLGPLVVKSSSPGQGAVRPEGTKVNLTLGPKPKRKKRH